MLQPVHRQSSTAGPCCRCSPPRGPAGGRDGRARAAGAPRRGRHTEGAARDVHVAMHRRVGTEPYGVGWLEGPTKRQVICRVVGKWMVDGGFRIAVFNCRSSRFFFESTCEDWTHDMMAYITHSISFNLITHSISFH